VYGVMMAVKTIYMIMVTSMTVVVKRLED